MARTPLAIPLPLATTDRLFAPEELAEDILNLQRTPNGTLIGVRGPAPYVPNYGAGYPADYGVMHGVYHTLLEGGRRDAMLVRSGTKLLHHRGFFRSWETLQSGLSDNPNARFPDQFCELGGKVVWTNGVDRPQAYDGYRLLPLGYDGTPSAPTPLGPAERTQTYRNGSGYSHPGRIGTPGDLLSGQDGSLLASEHYYGVMFEDAFGNLSAMSPVAGPVFLRSERTAVQSEDGTDLRSESVQLDDLLRQNLLTGIPLGPEGTVARWVYRSKNALQHGRQLYFLVRIPDNYSTFYADNQSDAELGGPAQEVDPVPTFKLCCVHDGCMYIANTTANPGVLIEMLPGTCGSPASGRWKFPDPKGSEITGLISFKRQLYAFTDTTMFAITITPEGIQADPVTTGIGCVAPSSLAATGFGTLVWLGLDGWYELNGGEVSPISMEIEKRFGRLSTARLPHAVAVWNPRTREYLCAVPEAGNYDNNVLYCYDGIGWRKQDHGVKYRALCVTKDLRRYTIGVGRADAAGLEPARQGVWVLDRAVRSYVPPVKTYRMRSRWIRVDGTGKQTFNVATVKVGFVESVRGVVTIRVYKNGRRDAVDFMTSSASPAREQMQMAPDDSAYTVSTMVVGGAGSTLREPVLHWRRFDINVRSASSFSFDIETSEPDTIHLAALGLEFAPDGDRVPR